jgi:hypothetical protein
MKKLSVRAMLIVVGFTAVACSDSKSKDVDSLTTTIDTVKPIGIPSPADSAAMDSSRNAPPTPDSSPRKQSDDVLPNGHGETYRKGSTVSPRDQDRIPDPPPNVIGETRKPGGTMGQSPLPTSGRDSAFGPKLTVDAKGNVVPIKR